MKKNYATRLDRLEQATDPALPIFKIQRCTIDELPELRAKYAGQKYQPGIRYIVENRNYHASAQKQD